MNWTRIPSLAALRAFEAAARHGSHSAAARELNVTHAAIAQHIRALEQEFGRPLMRRSGRGMALTQAGEVLVAPLAEGFAQIASAVDALRQEDQTRALHLSTTPSFAENWLMPRIGGFWSAHPEIQVAIQPSNELVNFRTDTVDLAIRFGTGDWPGLEATRLTGAQDLIVANADMAAKLAGVEMIRDQTILIDGAYREALRHLDGLPVDLETCQIRYLPTHSMALSAAREGNGIAIVTKAVAERDLELGSLVLIAQSPDTKHAYWIVTRKAALPERLKTFRAWLLSVA